MRVDIFKRVMGVVGVGALLMTQGCVTTESFGSGRGAGAKHKGPWRHQHQGSVTSSTTMSGGSGVLASEPLYGEEMYEPIITTSEIGADLPVVSAPSVAAAASEIYIVQPGDMISQLAVDFDTSSSTLIELNNLSNPDVLFVGQELRIPAGRGAVSRQTVTKTVTSNVVRGGTYQIQKGDTLSEIAMRAGVSLNDLRSLNQIQGDSIYAGQEIYIPSYGSVPAARSSAVETTLEPSVVSEPDLAPLSAAPVMNASSLVEVSPVEVPEGAIGVVREVQVYPGDTLDDFARDYSVSKAEILRANPQIVEGEPLREGFTLRIPFSE